jgi:hypothetical protein
MNPTATRSLLVAGLVACGGTLFALAAAPAATPPAKGDQWEVQSQMSMEGMPMTMPAQKVVVCAPKEWKEPPGGADEQRKCTVSDFRMTGPKATWKTHCDGPPPMDGDGEVTRAGDAFTGAIKLTTSGKAMTIRLNGKRLGDCDLK